MSVQNRAKYIPLAIVYFLLLAGAVFTSHRLSIAFTGYDMQHEAQGSADNAARVLSERFSNRKFDLSRFDPAQFLATRTRMDGGDFKVEGEIETNPLAIKVTLRRNMTTFYGSLLGWPAEQLVRTASARVSIPGYNVVSLAAD